MNKIINKLLIAVLFEFILPKIELFFCAIQQSFYQTLVQLQAYGKIPVAERLLQLVTNAITGKSI